MTLHLAENDRLAMRALRCWPGAVIQRLSRIRVLPVAPVRLFSILRGPMAGALQRRINGQRGSFRLLMYLPRGAKSRFASEHSTRAELQPGAA
jgi:hypothetical protein